MPAVWPGTTVSDFVEKEFTAQGCDGCKGDRQDDVRKEGPEGLQDIKKEDGLSDALIKTGIVGRGAGGEGGKEGRKEERKELPINWHVEPLQQSGGAGVISVHIL